MDTRAIREVARRHAGLDLLVLHGSRARGDHHAASDWDFGFLGDERLDPAALASDLALALETDLVDLANLARAGGLLRFRAASEGLPIYEARAGAFRDFQQEALRAWCDMEPVLRRAWQEVRHGLGR